MNYNYTRERISSVADAMSADGWQAGHMLRQLLEENDELQKQRDSLLGGIQAVESLISESTGVMGLHLNGDVAQWDELRTGGQFESWLIAFDEALSTSEKKETP